MNILLTSVGRRAYMVKYFQEALNGNGEVHVCNSERSIAFEYADKSFITPLIYDNQYIPSLLKYCEENHIGLLLSLFDIDLLVLAKNKEKFEEIGTNVIVSNQQIIEICNDKWKTFEFLQQQGFNVPKTYLSLSDARKALREREIVFPVIVKPRFGCGSLSIAKAYDEDELLFLNKKANREIDNSYLRFESRSTLERLIYQENLEGQEYGADIINNLKGDFQTAIIRKKIAMRSGETDIAEIVNEPIIYKELKRLGEQTGHIANMDVDIFLVEGKPYILEMNARFGGGYPFSHTVGCNLPKAIINWVNNCEISKNLLKVTMGTVYKEIILTIEEKLES